MTNVWGLQYIWNVGGIRLCMPTLSTLSQIVDEICGSGAVAHLQTGIYDQIHMQYKEDSLQTSKGISAAIEETIWIAVKI